MPPEAESACPACCTVLQLGASFFLRVRWLWVVEPQRHGGAATEGSPRAPEDAGDQWVLLPTAALSHWRLFVTVRCQVPRTGHYFMLAGIALRHWLSPQPLFPVL